MSLVALVATLSGGTSLVTDSCDIPHESPLLAMADRRGWLRFTVPSPGCLSAPNGVSKEKVSCS